MPKHYAFFLAILTIIFVEVISFLALFGIDKRYAIRYQPVDALSAEHRDILERFLQQDSSYIQIDPELGWVQRPNGRTGFYSANAQGIRGIQNYRPQTAKRLRISTYGDSFTHGNEVRFEETWQQQIEKLDTTLEVINYGVGGYGLDQAYLRYLEERNNLKSDIVLIGYMTDDIYRHQNIFRPFFSAKTGLPFGKPRFEVVDDSLLLDPNPFPTGEHYRELLKTPGKLLREAGKYDVYFQKAQKSGPLDFMSSVRLFKIAYEKVGDRFDNDFKLSEVYAESSASFQVACRIFDSFCRAVREDHATALIILFPNKRDVKRYRQTGKSDYHTLNHYLEVSDKVYLDLLPSFAEIKSDSLLNALFHNHYTPQGNRFVAERILNFLESVDKKRSVD